MKKFISLILSLVIILSISITPAFAAGSVNGYNFPQTFSGNVAAPMNASMLESVDYFTISVDADCALYTVTFCSDDMLNLTATFDTFKVGNTCKISYDAVAKLLDRKWKGFGISELDHIVVYCNTPNGYSYTMDVQEKSSIMTGIISYLKDAFKGLNNFFSDLFNTLFETLTNLFEDIKQFFADLLKDFIDFFAKIKEELDAKNTFWETFVESLKNLWKVLEGYTLQPVRDFFDSLSLGAIAIWWSIFDFPIIKELTIALVAVSLVAGIFKLFISL